MDAIDCSTCNGTHGTIGAAERCAATGSRNNLNMIPTIRRYLLDQED